MSLTFNFGYKAKTLLEIRADAMEAPAKLGVTAILVGATGVVTHIQLITALGHGRDAHVHLAQTTEVMKCGGYASPGSSHAVSSADN